ncbi:hypothetical protein AXG93_1923s1290 [Marchantia polymorpha subsp. ruderalis]|uniref:Uncharacterized protein n=1 Tax=Marchantia polymorpha subsp. ruderalis TaxID=1480154 RepID=A0A176VDF9_MARPO|nr:hypothetical protein AXG93_1923s1290 [Marchantia polymorpha subsp. ruderalis]
MTTLNLPAKMEFTMGSTEQKMDMTLDDIIKLGRKTGQKKQRVPIKNQNRPRNLIANGGNPAARAALQRSVAARSAKIRQGKFAEARARNGAGKLPVTQAAGKRAFATPLKTRSKQWMKSSDVRRNNLSRPWAGQGPKPNAYTAAAGNMKISVINNGSNEEESRHGVANHGVESCKVFACTGLCSSPCLAVCMGLLRQYARFGGQRQSAAPFRRRNGPNNPGRQVQNVGFTPQSMEVEYGQQVQPQRQKARTLDSLFAEIKERRNHQPQVVQPFTSTERLTSRRGGRGGFGSRGRGGQ